MQHKALLDTSDMLAVWLEQWEECLGDDFEEAKQLTKAQDKSLQIVESSAAIAAFQVQIRTRPRRPNNFARDFCAFALGFLLAGSVLQQLLTFLCSSHMLKSRQQAGSSVNANHGPTQSAALLRVSSVQPSKC